MNEEARQALADLLRARRLELGISARELARRAGVDKGLLTLLDQRKIAQPRADTLRALADALEIPLADVFAVTHWLPEGSLPSLRPYMRAKYDDLPEEALAEVERVVAEYSRKYGSGPRSGEDE